MEIVLFIVLAVVIAACVFLWRRGAVDKDKARKELDEALDHVRDDVKSWSDKIGKK